jgi:hypothetical protein
MKSPTNALNLLTDQHDEVDALFASLEDAETGPEKKELFTELADKLAAHGKIEEELFYPMVMAEQTKDLVLESAEEHLQIKRMLADLLELDPTSESDADQFDAKLKVLKEEVEHHAREEEEGELFPKVRSMIDADTLEACGAEMLGRFLVLLDSDPRKDVPSETYHAAEIEPAA